MTGFVTAGVFITGDFLSLMAMFWAKAFRMIVNG